VQAFVRPDYLWVLHNDAAHECLHWSVDAQRSCFEGQHSGYRRLAQPVTVRRRVELEHGSGRLAVFDGFEGEGEHEACVPWHLAPGVQVLGQPETRADGQQGLLQLAASGRTFELCWQSDAPWQAQLQAARVSPAYGRVLPTQVLRLSRRGALHGLHLTLQPIAARTESPAP
jgi:Heparinase II/III-like protein